MAKLSTLKPSIASNRNMIMNGDMSVNQRHQPRSFTATTGGQDFVSQTIPLSTYPEITLQPQGWYGFEDRWYATDRWKVSLYIPNQQAVPAGTAQGQVVVQTVYDAPSSVPALTKSTKITVKKTRPDAFLQPDDFLQMHQALEGPSVSRLKYGTTSALSATLSFWVKAFAPSNLNLSVRFKTIGGSTYKTTGSDNYQYLAPFTVSGNNTWEYKKITVPGNTLCTFLTGIGDWNFLVGFNLTCGTKFALPANQLNQWLVETEGLSARGIANNSNFLGALSSTINFTGIQFEVGDKATEFAHLPYNVVLEGCKRYFQKPLHHWETRVSNYWTLFFSTTMRATPSVWASHPSYITRWNKVYYQDVPTKNVVLSALDADL